MRLSSLPQSSRHTALVTSIVAHLQPTKSFFKDATMNGPLRFLQCAANRMLVVVSVAMSGALASRLSAQTSIDLLPAEITAYQAFTARVTFA